MSIHYADEQVTLHHGDSLAVLRTLPDASVNSCVTSPPYFGLRDYHGEPGQYGLEASPAEYVETMRALFAEVRRVLAADGTLWLNLGDSYYSGRGNPGPNAADKKQPARRGWIRALDRPSQDWAKPKDLLGIPWRVAFALQDDGWTLRNAIVWRKTNPTPDPVGDRLSSTYEQVFMFSKSRRYWFDVDSIGEGSNPGDVWEFPTSQFPQAHFAVMAPKLAERCIAAGCKPGGTVLDPFSGSGTTGMVAQRHGRKYVGIDLNAGYLDLSLRTRLQQAALDFEAGDVA